MKENRHRVLWAPGRILAVLLVLAAGFLFLQRPVLAAKAKVSRADLTLKNPDPYGYSDCAFDTELRKEEVTAVIFRDSLAGAPESAADVSESGRGRVLLWTEPGDGGKTLILAGDGGINFPKNASYLFSGYCREGAGYENLARITFSDGVDTSRTTSMRGLFSGCDKLKTLDLSGFDTSAVTDMWDMFGGCSALERLELGSFDTGRVRDMGGMFRYCRALEGLEISDFDTGAVRNMGRMFSGCAGLRSLELGNFDTACVKDMQAMFRDCRSLERLKLPGFDTGSVRDMRAMFSGCTGLKGLDLRSFDTGCVTDMQDMFQDCSSLRSLEVGDFDTRRVVNMTRMFAGCSGLRTLDLGGFDTENAACMDSMFHGCQGLEYLDLSSFHTENVISMQGMFGSCSSLKTLDLSGFDTLQANIQCIFDNCSPELVTDDARLQALLPSRPADRTGYREERDRILRPADPRSDTVFGTEIPKSEVTTVTFFPSLDGAPDRAQDVSLTGNGRVLLWTEPGREGLNLFIAGDGKVRFPGCSRGLFEGFSSVIEIVFAGAVDTSHVAQMDNMFYGCSSLLGLELYSFDTGNVQSMQAMFGDCSSLVGVSLDQFDTGNVRDMYGMFGGCTALQGLDLSSFDVSRVDEMDHMFDTCRSLRHLDLSSFRGDAGMGMFYGCSPDLELITGEESFRREFRDHRK